MNEPKKDLWCPTCKEYPDEIKDVYDWTIEKRVWKGDCYELLDVDFGNSHAECSKCGDILDYRPQDEGEPNANPLPEVQGEVSSEEGIPTDINEDGGSDR